MGGKTPTGVRKVITILYFAWLRERMHRTEEHLTLPPGIATVGALMAKLAARDEIFANPKLIRAAVNQDFATPETPIAAGDEIAFFPPVTGG